MITIGLDNTGKKQYVNNDIICYCPHCGEELIAKMGTKKVWHWAHKNTKGCSSSNYKPMTKWHSDWQSKFDIDFREVRINFNGFYINTYKIADIRIGDVSIEFQHSPISNREVKRREFVHNKIIWVTDNINYMNLSKIVLYDTGEYLICNKIKNDNGLYKKINYSDLINNTEKLYYKILQIFRDNIK